MNEDAETIEAIKGGDHDRFAELVDRHQRLAYAIAWSRLGDATLAEEAAQESFVRAFRYLGALRQPGRFASWLGQIVRNAASTIGRREQRELETKERWVLEQADSAEEESSAEMPSPEGLDSALQVLSDEHREALVLFYFRGESTASAAEIVGIKEGAFRTRLTRARARLKAAIEKRTENALENLRPSRNLTPLVLAALPAGPMGANAATAAGGVGGKFLGASFKAGMWALIIPLIQIPLSFLAEREIQKSYRNPRDRRLVMRKRSQENSRVGLLVFLPIFAVITGVVHSTMEYPGFWHRYWRLGLLMLATPLALECFRILRVDRSTFGRAQLVAGGSWLFILLGLMIEPSWYWKLYAIQIPVMIGALVYRDSREFFRMDKNLYLRQALGGLGKSRSGELQERSLTDHELGRFARWLGERRLIHDYRIRAHGMTLYLGPVRHRFEICRFWRSGHPTLVVGRNGMCGGI